MVESSFIYCIPLIKRRKKKIKYIIIFSTFIFLGSVAAHRGHADTVTDSTVKHSIPAQQEELIRLQEQVKKGAVSVDEALDRFKQWQHEKQRLQSTLQVGV